MTNTPTPEQVAEALKDVTPGPWSSNTLGEFGPVHDGDDQAFGMICDPVGQCHWPNAVDNASFIAWARNNVEALAADRDAQKARAEKLGRELNIARYGQPDFSWSVHKEAMGDLEAALAAEKAKVARLVEALELIAMEYNINWQAGRWARIALAEVQE